MRTAGIAIDDVGHIDLYSCFASSVNLACDALGIATDDQRGLTVTGGLPFSGGAGSNYMLHSIAAMVDVLRADPGSNGLVSGVGMHMTKHCYAVYSTQPGAIVVPNQPEVQASTDSAHPATVITNVYSGSGRVASYTVAHGRDGAPEWGLVIADLADGTRAYGKVDDAALLVEMEQREFVGETVAFIAGENGVNEVKL